jgi:hypothetical protein
LAPRKWREGSLRRMIKDPLAGREERSDSEFQCDRRLPASLLRFNVLGAFLQLASEKGALAVGHQVRRPLDVEEIDESSATNTCTAYSNEFHLCATSRSSTRCGEQNRPDIGCRV